MVPDSMVKFVENSCDEEGAEAIPLTENMELDVAIPFPRAGSFKLCLISPGASRSYLYNNIVVDVQEMTITSSDSLKLFTNVKKTVDVDLTVSVKDITEITIFLATSESCEDGVGSEVTNEAVITRSSAVQFRFTQGYPHALKVCARYADLPPVYTGATLYVYSASFDPPVWRPFYGIRYYFSGVTLINPYHDLNNNKVYAKWIPISEKCEDETELGDPLSEIESVVFEDSGELQTCLKFDPSSPFEAVPLDQLRVIVYGKISLAIAGVDRLVVDKEFTVIMSGKDVNKINQIWWRNDLGQESRKSGLYNNQFAPFTLPTPGLWWIVVEYICEDENRCDFADYRDEPGLNRTVSQFVNVDVLYWLKNREIPGSDTQKKSNLEVRGYYLQSGDKIAFLPMESCQDCQSASTAYSIVADPDNSMLYYLEEPLNVEQFAAQSCVCFSFGENNWMSYPSEVLHIPEENTVISTDQVAYLIPVASSTDSSTSVQARVNLDLYGHVGIVENAMGYLLPTGESCSPNNVPSSTDGSSYVETRKGDQYGYVSSNVFYNVPLPSITSTYIAFWSLDADCSGSVSSTTTSMDGIFTWSGGVKAYLSEDAHLCVRFFETTLFVPVNIVTLSVYGLNDKRIDMFRISDENDVNGDCKRTVNFEAHGTVEKISFVDYETKMVIDDNMSCDRATDCELRSADYYEVESDKVGVMVKFAELETEAFMEDVVIHVRDVPSVATPKMYVNHDHLLKLESNLFDPEEKVEIKYQNQEPFNSSLTIASDGLSATASVNLHQSGIHEVYYEYRDLEGYSCPVLNNKLIGFYYLIF